MIENKQNIYSNINLSNEDKFRNPAQRISKEITYSSSRNLDYANNNDLISEDNKIVDDLSKKENLNSKNYQKQIINEYSLLPELLKNMQNFDDENLKIFNKHFNIEIDELNLTIKTYNKLRRNNINFIYQLALFSKNDLLQVKNFGNQAYEELMDSLINYEGQFDNNDNLKEENKDLDDFWNLIQLKFDKIRENLDFSYVSNIDEHLEIFFSSAYKENSNFRILETLFIVSKDAWDNLADSFKKNSEFVFHVYKYFLFLKFLNFENPIESIHWINDFNKKINYDDNKILKVYFQRILGKTLSQIARDNGVSREQIRKIESKATRLIGINSAEIIRITNQIEENLVFKKEKLLCEEYIEKFGHLPYLDVELGNEVNQVFKKCLESNLKERLEIYEKYNFDIPPAEFDFHYEFIANSKKAVGTGYWLNFKNLEKFLYRHASKLGEPMLMPKQKSLPDTVRGVVTRFGGQSKVASLIGLKYQGQLVNPEGGRKYWTDEKLNILIDDINKFYIQDLSLMPNKTQITNFFKATSINEYKDKKIGSVMAALTKFEQLTWQEVAQRFERKDNF